MKLWLGLALVRFRCVCQLCIASTHDHSLRDEEPGITVGVWMCCCCQILATGMPVADVVDTKQNQSDQWRDEFFRSLCLGNFKTSLSMFGKAHVNSSVREVAFAVCMMWVAFVALCYVAAVANFVASSGQFSPIPLGGCQDLPSAQCVYGWEPCTVRCSTYNETLRCIFALFAAGSQQPRLSWPGSVAQVRPLANDRRCHGLSNNGFTSHAAVLSE